MPSLRQYVRLIEDSERRSLAPKSTDTAAPAPPVQEPPKQPT